MLTFCEHTMRAVRAELDAELVEFNGEPDHVHLLVAYPPTLAISTLIHRRLCPRPHARTPMAPFVFRRLLRRRTSVDHQAIHRRPSTSTLSAGLRPPTDGMA